MAVDCRVGVQNPLISLVCANNRKKKGNDEPEACPNHLFLSFLTIRAAREIRLHVAGGSTLADASSERPVIGKRERANSFDGKTGGLALIIWHVVHIL